MLLYLLRLSGWEERIQRYKIECGRNANAVDARTADESVGHPLSEATDVAPNTLTVRVKRMRTVAVDEDAVFIALIIKISADVRTSVVYCDCVSFLSALACHHTARDAATYNTDERVFHV